MLVNGVPLDDPLRGWSLLAESRPRLVGSVELASVSVPGRDGVVGAARGSFAAPVVSLVVDAPLSDFEALVALFVPGGVLERDGRVTDFEYASHDYAEDPDNGFAQLSFVLRLPGVFWRAAVVETFAGTGEVVCWPGLSAPVQDAMVRVKGPVSGVQVSDSSGAWVRLPDAAAGQWVRFEADSGRAFRTSANEWSGGVDISGLVDFDGPRGVFEITPVMRSGPDDRAGVVSVSGSVVVEVRGRSAHAL